MDWQQSVSLLIVAIAALLLGRYEIRKRRDSRFRACGHHCDCSPGKPMDTWRNQAARENERPPFSDRG